MPKIKMPEITASVVVTHDVTGREFTGVCTDHFSSQWELTTEEGWVMVVHPNWRWRYAESRT